MTSKYNVDENDTKFMKNLATRWWDEKGVWKCLHDMNGIRIKYIVERLVAIGKLKRACLKAPDVLKGLKVLDVGCGGGILAEVLGKYQAEVVGLEPVEELVEVAREHLKKTSRNHSMNVTYIIETIEEHCKTHENHYDVIVCSEVIEHVEMKESLINAMTKALKPGGSLFMSTLGKTAVCWFIAWLWAEWILNIVPRGNHNFFWFITAADLSKMVNNAGCNTVDTRGLMYMVPFGYWRYWSYKGVDYILHAIKE